VRVPRYLQPRCLQTVGLSPAGKSGSQHESWWTQAYSGRTNSQNLTGEISHSPGDGAAFAQMARAGRLARLGQLLDSRNHAPILMSKSDKRVVKIGPLDQISGGFADFTPYGPENGRGPGICTWGLTAPNSSVARSFLAGFSRLTRACDYRTESSDHV
jgi:hypothetical protein